MFRHDETQSNIVKFNVAAVQNDFSEEIIVYANAGRPNSNADQIYSTYGVSAIDSVFTNDLKNALLSMPTKVSDLTNDSGFLTLSTLPKYNGGVQ